MNHSDYTVLRNMHEKHDEDVNQGFPLLAAQDVLSCADGSSSQHTTPSSILDSETSSNDIGTDRRSRILEKNRRAAARCRQRKKLWVEELTRQHEQAKQRNEQLQEIVPRLREEVYSLKNQLLAHEGCDCHAVREYIKVFLVNDVVQKSKRSGAEQLEL